MNYIFGITGKKNAGKDTVASMINYITHVGVASANYTEWLVKQVVIDNQHKDRIYHFADPLKDVLSIIYNIDRKYFDDRKYKDELYYCFNTRKFVEYKQMDTNYTILGNNFNDKYTLSECLCGLAFKDKDNSNQLYAIKLRTLMQYFGTDICRRYLDADIWIKSGIAKIADIAISKHICIVPDVRFNNEAQAVRFTTPSLYGRVIKVIRDDDSSDEHSSENEDIIADYTINNNVTKMNLFYQVLNLLMKIIN